MDEWMSKGNEDDAMIKLIKQGGQDGSNQQNSSEEPVLRPLFINLRLSGSQ